MPSLAQYCTMFHGKTLTLQKGYYNKVLKLINKFLLPLAEKKQQNGKDKVDASGDHKSTQNGAAHHNGTENGVHEKAHHNGTKNGVQETETNGHSSKSEESDDVTDKKQSGGKSGDDEKKKEIASALFGVSNCVNNF